MRVFGSAGTAAPAPSVVVVAATDVLVRHGERGGRGVARADDAIETALEGRGPRGGGAGGGGWRPRSKLRRCAATRCPRWKISTAVAVRRTSRRSCSGTRVCGTE